ncbi:hypothetical protein [Streptacidiphilus carbonis]|uniref:hypothetical protein n=1 Tax=Streptacidiphilus carbonis TaxID=105422 RepID=UPI0013774EC3|nr:hypothetical protein [Streptacidiphilus carbonis]
MAKQMPPAGRPHRTPGAQPPPRTPGATQGTALERAQLAKPGLSKAPDAKPTPQGGSGS